MVPVRPSRACACTCGCVRLYVYSFLCFHISLSPPPSLPVLFPCVVSTVLPAPPVFLSSVLSVLAPSFVPGWLVQMGAFTCFHLHANVNVHECVHPYASVSSCADVSKLMEVPKTRACTEFNSLCRPHGLSGPDIQRQTDRQTVCLEGSEGSKFDSGCR